MTNHTRPPQELSISSILVGIAAFFFVFMFVANLANTISKPVEDIGCGQSFKCTASKGSVIFYTDYIFTGTGNEHIVRSLYDAKERFAYFLDYGKGNFHYDRIDCECSDKHPRLWFQVQENIKLESDSIYREYLFSKINKKPQFIDVYAKGPNE